MRFRRYRAHQVDAARVVVAEVSSGHGSPSTLEHIAWAFNVVAYVDSPPSGRMGRLLCRHVWRERWSGPFERFSLCERCGKAGA